MEFTRLHAGSQCQCVDEAVEDLATIFARKLRRAEMTEADFQSNFERNVPLDGSGCTLECLHRGVSINKFEEETRAEVLQKYYTTFRVAPGIKKYFAKFRLRPNAGKVKATPTAHDKHHFTLLKSDNFSLTSVELIEIAEIVAHV